MIDPRLERFLPIRCVIRRTPNLPVEGLIEHSFSMGWSPDRVNIFWSGRAYSLLGEHILDGVKNAQHNCGKTTPDLFTAEELVIDPLAADSPIEVDWERWLAAMKGGSKFYARNAPFKMKAAVGV